MTNNSTESISKSRGDRIKEAVKSLGHGGAKAIAAKCKNQDGGPIASQALTGWYKTGCVKVENLLVVSEMTGYSFKYLLDGTLPKLSNDSIKSVAEGPVIKGKVFVISWVEAGNYQEVIDNHYPGDGLEEIPTTTPVRAHTFALIVKGDSMEPQFTEGMVLIVEPEMQAENGDFVIAKNGDDEATFKKLVKDGGDWYLKPMNDRYPIKPLGDSCIIGVVRSAEIKFR